MRSGGAVLVFARAPTRGEVKTRLAKSLGDEIALALHVAFLRDSLLAARLAGARVILARTPGPRFPEESMADEVIVQRGDSFGGRFDAALSDAVDLLPDGSPLVMVGGDTPHLAPGALRSALDAVVERGSALGPSDDGGFYLIGSSGAVPPLSSVFDDPSRAFDSARTIMESLGAGPAILPSLFDIDTAEDITHLDALLRNRGRDQGWIPPATAEALRLLDPRFLHPAREARSTAAIPDSNA